jgi:hypothetical protein
MDGQDLDGFVQLLNCEMSRRKVLATVGGLAVVAVTGKTAVAGPAPLKVSARASKTGEITLVGSWSGLSTPATIWFSLQVYQNGLQVDQIPGPAINTTASRGRFTAKFQGTPGGGTYEYGGFINTSANNSLGPTGFTGPLNLGIPTFVSVKS